MERNELPNQSVNFTFESDKICRDIFFVPILNFHREKDTRNLRFLCFIRCSLLGSLASEGPALLTATILNWYSLPSFKSFMVASHLSGVHSPAGSQSGLNLKTLTRGDIFCKKLDVVQWFAIPLFNQTLCCTYFSAVQNFTSTPGAYD